MNESLDKNTQTGKTILGSPVSVTLVATGFEFTEGPLWHPEGCLWFSDTPANKVYKLYPDGSTSIAFDGIGFSGSDKTGLSDQIGPNGIAIGNDNAVYICQHGDHGICRIGNDNKMTPFISHYKDRKFNSPNDLIFHPKGWLYFTDPPYGLKDQILNPSKFQLVAGLYGLINGSVHLFDDSFNYPNGVCLSVDNRFLYVSSNHPDEPVIRKYEIGPDGELSRPAIFARQNADGMTIDNKGQLYICTDDGVKILSGTGEHLATIEIPETPSNICWGMEQKNVLYITARSSVYKVSGLQG